MVVASASNSARAGVLEPEGGAQGLAGKRLEGELARRYSGPHCDSSEKVSFYVEEPNDDPGTGASAPDAVGWRDEAQTANSRDERWNRETLGEDTTDSTAGAVVKGFASPPSVYYNQEQAEVPAPTVAEA